METAEINAGSPIPLYYQVKNIIKKQILNGEIQPGTPLFSENALVRKYKISRNTVRQAFTHLVNEGFARRIQGKGTYASIPEEKLKGEKGIIGYILFGRKFDNPFYAETLSGVDMVTKSSEKHLLFTEVEEQRSQNELPIMIRDKSVDGVIITGIVSRKVLSMMDATKIPYVLIGIIKPDEKHYLVRTDAEKGTAMMMDYLLKKGHRKIGFINGNNSYVEYRQIGETFNNIMKKNGTPHPNMSVSCKQFNAEEAYKATRKILASCRQEYPTAIFTANYLMAFGAMKAVSEYGLKIPEDISISAFGNYGKNEAMNYYSEILISTVEYDIRALGRHAAEILFDVLGGKRNVTKTVLLPPSLKEGNTVRCITIEKEVHHE